MPLDQVNAAFSGAVRAAGDQHFMARTRAIVRRGWRRLRTQSSNSPASRRWRGCAQAETAAGAGAGVQSLFEGARQPAVVAVGAEIQEEIDEGSNPGPVGLNTAASSGAALVGSSSEASLSRIVSTSVLSSGEIHLASLGWS